jgi:hypothetical protein
MLQNTMNTMNTMQCSKATVKNTAKREKERHAGMQPHFQNMRCRRQK